MKSTCSSIQTGRCPTLFVMACKLVEIGSRVYRVWSRILHYLIFLVLLDTGENDSGDDEDDDKEGG